MIYHGCLSDVQKKDIFSGLLGSLLDHLVQRNFMDFRAIRHHQCWVLTPLVYLGISLADGQFFTSLFLFCWIYSLSFWVFFLLLVGLNPFRRSP